ncbi:unnamed protein product [Lactuca virosa]|uniref:Uncharacterized protein n=1 Tax=Lactuca virosa TaxID=75947 RepID=A0AAU9NHH3_9ASTR|nr:unnamed protein product [Lactuca virosa]
MKEKVVTVGVNGGERWRQSVVMVAAIAGDGGAIERCLISKGVVSANPFITDGGDFEIVATYDGWKIRVYDDWRSIHDVVYLTRVLKGYQEFPDLC